MQLTAIAVVASNGVIGDGASQPFHIHADLQRFKRTTLGHCLIMGHSTYRVMGALPGRVSLVLSRRPDSVADAEPAPNAPASDLESLAERRATFAVGSLDEALKVASSLGDDEPFLVGGGEIYRLGLDRCDAVDVTEVDAPAEGHVSFPALDPAVWREESREGHPENDPPFSFVRYVRR